jgi:hypothetical protein
LKNKLREDLKDELAAISGDTAAGGAGGKGNRKSSAAGKASSAPDYFELVYQCVNTHMKFLNVISFHARSPVEPDIDLVILQALLNGELNARLRSTSSDAAVFSATSASDSTKTNIQQKREQLHLALEWNRVDIAKNFIMQNDHDWEVRWSSQGRLMHVSPFLR